MFYNLKLALILDTKKVEDVEEDKVNNIDGDKLNNIDGDEVKDAKGDKNEDIVGEKVEGVSERVEDEAKKIEYVQGDIAAESSLKVMDDASSTEDEDIRLVVEDASDETDTETQVAKTPEVNTEESEKAPDESDEENKVKNKELMKASGDVDEEPEETSEKSIEKEVLSGEIQDPSSPIGSCIALDNITSNFDEDSCTSFDKSLEEIDPKKTEGENKTPNDDVPAEKTSDEAMVIESEDINAKSNDEVTTMEIDDVEVKEKKEEIIAGKIDL